MPPHFLGRYLIVVSTNTCYYSENQVLGGVTTRDMSLFETCHYSKIQKFKNFEIAVSNMGTILFKSDFFMVCRKKKKKKLLPKVTRI